MTPLFFATELEFRQWLEANHDKEAELLVGFYKINSGKPSMTWSQSVDQALCFGWIDSVKHTIDKDSYQIRFCPRRKNSIWSAVNIQKVEKLTEEGLMRQAGIESFANRKENKSRIYSFENEEIQLSAEMEEEFKANETAWTFFQALAPSYKKTSKYWVMSAKQETTRKKRLYELIAESEAGTNRWKQHKNSENI